MNYLDYLALVAKDARNSLLRQNAEYLDCLQRSLDRCNEYQNRHEEEGKGGVVDVLESSFSWIESHTRSVESARARYVEAKAALEAAQQIAFYMSTGKLSTDTMIDFGLTAEKEEKNR